VEFLQGRRAKGHLKGTWQPVMGHVEEGETAAAAAVRELAEEAGYAVAVGNARGSGAAGLPAASAKTIGGLIGLWQLENLNTYFLASIDTIVMGPGFAAEVTPGLDPVMDDSHDAFRWVPRDHADRHFIWPGQRQAIDQVLRDVLDPDSPTRDVLKISLG
jgi:8-oxo-dGTP pyrophosphatase MutT (NUDIX family)